jgi:Tfp pilus assembly protein PilF
MIKKIWQWSVLISSVLWLFLPMPLVADAWGWGKNWWMVVLALVNLLLWIGVWLKDGRGKVQTGMVSWWWLVTGVGLITLFLANTYTGVRFRGLVGSGGLMTMVGVGIWWWLWQQLDANVKRKMVGVMGWAGVVLVMLAVAVFLIPQKMLPISWPPTNPWLMIDAGWSVTGSVVSEIVILLVLAFVVGHRLIVRIKKSENYWMWAIMEALLLIGVVIDGYRLFKGAWSGLPMDTAWSIALETLKRKPWVGVGWGNFIEAFNTYRPVGYNLTSMWATAFKNSTMTGLQWLTEAGMIGLGVMIWGMLIGLKKNTHGKRNWIKLGGVLALLLLPITSGGWWIMAWLLALKSETVEKEVLMLAGESKRNIGPWIIGGFTAVFVMGIGFMWIRLTMAEVAIKNSITAAAKNLAQPTYDWQRRAIEINPWEPEYRRLYSQTNLALAQATLSKETPSDAEKQQAAVLVQQSVNEGKAAIALDGLNSGYWANLAVIYRSLVGLVDGAADWSYESYNQAIALDSVNPLLKLNLGGLLYAANRFEDADRIFEGVVTSKPDLANGWYNWAYTAKKLNKINDAVARLNQAVSLVPADSGDFEKATLELTEWKKELEASQTPVPTPKEAETLKTPEPLPSVSEDEKPIIPSGVLAPPTGAMVTPKPSEAPSSTTSEKVTPMPSGETTVTP